LGAISSANILFETSTAKTKSTPSLLTVLSSVPIFGLTSDMVENNIKRIKKSNLIFGLKVEMLGLNTLSKSDEIYLICVLFLQLLKNKNPTTSTGIITNK